MSEPSNDYRKKFAQARNVVVKVGTRVLTDNGRVNYPQISSLVEQISQLKKSGQQISLVSSGAIGTAMHRLQLPRPISLGELQAFAAVGQAELIHHYNQEFGRYGYFAAQVLLTADDVSHRQRYLNLRNAFFSLFEIGAIPIINENDCVATDEIAVTFGDNDRLAASVSMLVDADLLIILSDVSGLFDRHPDHPEAQRVSFVESVDEKITRLTNDPASSRESLSKGGMSSKLNAASLATSAGIPTVIANGQDSKILERIIAGEDCGTCFLPAPRQINSWKRWLKGSVDVPGGVHVDQGAIKAVCQNGKSLLPIGVTQVEGQFDAGDLIFVKGPGSQTVAQGVSNFSSKEIEQIKRMSTPAIAELLGKVVHEELIHRNNLVLS